MAGERPQTQKPKARPRELNHAIFYSFNGCCDIQSCSYAWYHALPMPARRLLGLHGPVKKKGNDPFSNLPRIGVHIVSAETEQVMDEAQDK